MADFAFFLPLPKKTKILVEEGQDLLFGQKVASYEKLAQKQINLVEQLKVPAKNVSRFLLVELGRKVDIGEPIAKIDQLFKKVTVNSPVKGQVFAFDNNTGILTIEIAKKSRDLLSPLAGKVKKVSQEGIAIDTKTEAVFDLANGWGENRLGELAYHQGNLVSFTCQYQNKIILVDKECFSVALVNKAQTIGCLGIISDCADMKIVSQEELTLSQINPVDKDKLGKFIGQTVIIDNQQKKIAIIPK